MPSHHDHGSIRTQVEDFVSDGSNQTENPNMARLPRLCNETLPH